MHSIADALHFCYAQLLMCSFKFTIDFRVHCTNLFEETVVQQDLLKVKVKNGSSVKEIKALNKTVIYLEKLFDTSGCKKQICDQCNVATIDPKEFDVTNYYCILAREKVG